IGLSCPKRSACGGGWKMENGGRESAAPTAAPRCSRCRRLDRVACSIAALVGDEKLGGVRRSRAPAGGRGVLAWRVLDLRSLAAAAADDRGDAAGAGRWNG